MEIKVNHLCVKAEGNPNEPEFMVEITDVECGGAIYLTRENLASVSMALSAIAQLVELGTS